MTIGELVRLLERYPSDLRVVVNGYEDGYDDVAAERISLTKIALDTGKHSWEGAHGDADWLAMPGDANQEFVEAVVLSRASH